MAELFTVGVAQLVEHQVVALVVAGSIPVTHPIKTSLLTFRTQLARQTDRVGMGGEHCWFIHSDCGCGGIGRHAGLRNQCFIAWEFESPHPHH